MLTLSTLRQLERILSFYPIKPQEWADDERHDPMLPDPQDVLQRVVRPFLGTAALLTPMERRRNSAYLFQKGLETLDSAVMTAVLAVVDPGDAPLYVSFTGMCAIMGISATADLHQKMQTLPCEIYHAFANLILVCMASDAVVVDPHLFVLCSGSPDVLRGMKQAIEPCKKDPLTCQVYFECSTKLGAANMVDALRALPADYDAALISSHVALAYRAWITRSFSSMRLASHWPAGDEPYIGELVHYMHQLIGRFTGAHDVLIADLCAHLRRWAMASYEGTLEWAQAGAQVRARVFPNMTTFVSYTGACVPEEKAPFALSPTGAVLYVSDLFVPPWFDGACIQAEFFGTIERLLATTQKRVAFVIVGPVYADTFHVLDVRYGWERMGNATDVYAVCPPRLGDPCREREFFYWATPLVRVRVSLMHALLSRQEAACPSIAWDALTTKQSVAHKARTVLEVCESLATTVALPRNRTYAPYLHGHTKTMWCLVRVQPRCLILQNAKMPLNWEGSLWGVMMDFLVQIGRIYAWEIYVEGEKMVLLREQLHAGRCWKTHMDRPLPRFSKQGFWRPVPRAPTARRPELPAGDDGSAWVRQREADLTHGPKAEARPAYEY